MILEAIQAKKVTPANSEPFCREQREMLLLLLAQIDRLPDGLDQLEHIAFFWSDILAGIPVAGIFRPAYPATIYIGAHLRDKVLDDDNSIMKMCTPTIYHEITHLAQHQRMGWRYHLAAVPGIREIALEAEARAMERYAAGCLGLRTYWYTDETERN